MIWWYIVAKNKKSEKSTPEKKKFDQPFRPASCIDFTINKFPEYISDGIEQKKNEDLLKRAQLRKEGKLNSFTGGKMKLGGTIKSYPISSVIDKSISHCPPKWAQESLQNGRKIKEFKKVINYNDPIVLFVSIELFNIYILKIIINIINLFNYSIFF